MGRGNPEESNGWVCGLLPVSSGSLCGGNMSEVDKERAYQA